MGVASALITQFVFLVKSSLKMCCTNIVLRQKLLQSTIRNFWCKNIFDGPTGLASALTAQFGFLAKNALEIRFTTIFSDKSCYKSNSATFMLCNIFSISFAIMEL